MEKQKLKLSKIEKILVFSLLSLIVVALFIIAFKPYSEKKYNSIETYELSNTKFLDDLGYEVLSVNEYSDSVKVTMKDGLGGKTIQMRDGFIWLVSEYNVSEYAVEIVNQDETCFYYFVRSAYESYLESEDIYFWSKIFDEGYCLN